MPSPADIRASRISLGLTQAQAGELVGASARAWRAWESGFRVMPGAKWELWEIKTRGVEMPKITYEYARHHSPYKETVEGSVKDVARRAMLEIIHNTAMPKRILLSGGEEVWNQEDDGSMDLLAGLAGTNWMDV